MKITVGIKKPDSILIPKTGKIVVRHEFGQVVVFIFGKKVVMNTVIAHKIGYDIAMKVPILSHNELILLTINGEEIELPASSASRVSTALLRKADDADDWQKGVRHDRQALHSLNRFTGTDSRKDTH